MSAETVVSVAQYEDSETHGRLFVGWEPRECGEHRTVGDYRAWCFDCSEWCYSREIDMACKGCEIAHLRHAAPTPCPTPDDCTRLGCACPPPWGDSDPVGAAVSAGEPSGVLGGAGEVARAGEAL